MFSLENMMFFFILPVNLTLTATNMLMSRKEGRFKHAKVQTCGCVFRITFSAEQPTLSTTGPGGYKFPHP